MKFVLDKSLGEKVRIEMIYSDIFCIVLSLHSEIGRIFFYKITKKPTAVVLARWSINRTFLEVQSLMAASTESRIKNIGFNMLQKLLWKDECIVISKQARATEESNLYHGSRKSIQFGKGLSLLTRIQFFLEQREGKLSN